MKHIYYYNIYQGIQKYSTYEYMYHYYFVSPNPLWIILYLKDAKINIGNFRLSEL